MKDFFDMYDKNRPKEKKASPDVDISKGNPEPQPQPEQKQLTKEDIADIVRKEVEAFYKQREEEEKCQ